MVCQTDMFTAQCAVLSDSKAQIILELGPEK